MENYKVVLGNKIIDHSSNMIQVLSPISNKAFAQVPGIESKEQIDSIFELAQNVFKKYRRTSIEQREKRLLRFCSLLEKNKNELAEILVKEIAKNKNDSLKEIVRSIEYIKETIEEYKKIIDNPLVIDETTHKIKGKIGEFIYQPLGVVLAISPFNYPVNLLISKLAPALISGNVVVYKPATQGSIVGARISELLYESGFNNGEVSCIIGSGSDIGDTLILNKHVKMISFTGSTNVGKHIFDVTSGVKLVLELGGKDPAIILPDANLDLATKEIINGAFNYNGQRCTAIKRVLAHKDIYDELVSKLNESLKTLKVGSAIEDNDITELISQKSLSYNIDLVNDALNNGATSLQKIETNGNILKPIILSQVNLNARIAWEEPFGPILPIIKYNSVDEAIEIANQSEFGLQASIFTADLQQAKQIALEIESGTVNINRSSSRGPDIFPFLGIKGSGFGVQGVRDAIISMNEIKGIIQNN